MFSDELDKISWEETTKAIYSKTDADVRRALGKEHCDVNDFMALISRSWHGLAKNIQWSVSERRFPCSCLSILPTHVPTHASIAVSTSATR